MELMRSKTFLEGRVGQDRMLDWLPLVKSLVVMVMNYSDTYTKYWRAMTVNTLCRVMLVP